MDNPTNWCYCILFCVFPFVPMARRDIQFLSTWTEPIGTSERAWKQIVNSALFIFHRSLRLWWWYFDINWRKTIKQFKGEIALRNKWILKISHFMRLTLRLKTFRNGSASDRSPCHCEWVHNQSSRVIVIPANAECGSQLINFDCWNRTMNEQMNILH